MSKSMKAVMLAVLVLCLAALAFGQKAPKYDKATEVKLSTAIDSVKAVTVDGQERVSLMVKDGADLVEVYVAPKAFLADMSTEFAKGDQVEITGSKLKNDNGVLILAREVIKGNNTLVLRDKAGEPVWSWMEKKTAEGK